MLCYAALVQQRPAVAFVVASAVLSLCLVACEALAPLEAVDETPHQRRTEVFFNIGTGATLVACHPLLTATPTLWTGLEAAPFALQFLAGWALHDLLLYGWRRALHESGDGFLWRLHEIHHQPRRMTFMAGGRSHLIEILVTVLCLVAARVLLGLSGEVMLWVLMMPVMSGAVHHTNADLRLGPLNYLFPGPELDRAHHDADPSAALNYATSFPLWDVRFGTAVPPRGGHQTRYGLWESDDQETTWRSAHRHPWSQPR